MHNLQDVYEQGLGVPVNDERAESWKVKGKALQKKFEEQTIE